MKQHAAQARGGAEERNPSLPTLFGSSPDSLSKDSLDLEWANMDKPMARECALGGTARAEEAEPLPITWQQTFRATWRVASIFFSDRQTRCKAIALLVCLSLVMMLETALAACLAELINRVTNTLVDQDQQKFYQELKTITTVCLIYLPCILLQEALSGAFTLEWRRKITRDMLGLYIDTSQAYYRMKTQACDIDNPDQRIGQDVQDFTQSVVKLLTTVVSSSMKVVLMSTILYRISKELFFYTTLGSAVMTVLFLKIFGSRLMRLTRGVLALEATFRFGLIHVRENAEAIAFYMGVPFELMRVTQMFLSAIQMHYRRLVVMVIFTGGQKGIVMFAYFLPILLLGPKILRGEVQIGTISQTNMLFGILLTSLTALVADLGMIAALGAQAVRIEELKATLDEMHSEVSDLAGKKSIALVELRSDGDGTGADNPFGGPDLCLHLDEVSLQPPLCSTATLTGLSLELHRGESMLVCGDSGIGKSSLLRAIGGLWASGQGVIHRSPASNCFFLPQDPYLCLGTLRENAEYPVARDRHEKGLAERTRQIEDALEAVNLGHLASRHGLDTEVDFEGMLSGGEKQRLGFARLLLRPRLDLAILDEATSALDVANEEALYRLLQDRAHCHVSVGHRPNLAKFHTHKLQLTRLAEGGCSGHFFKFDDLAVQ